MANLNIGSMFTNNLWATLPGTGAKAKLWMKRLGVCFWRCSYLFCIYFPSWLSISRFIALRSSLCWCADDSQIDVSVPVFYSKLQEPRQLRFLLCPLPRCHVVTWNVSWPLKPDTPSCPPANSHTFLRSVTVPYADLLDFDFRSNFGPSLASIFHIQSISKFFFLYSKILPEFGWSSPSARHPPHQSHLLCLPGTPGKWPYVPYFPCAYFPW